MTLGNVLMTASGHGGDRRLREPIIRASIKDRQTPPAETTPCAARRTNAGGNLFGQIRIAAVRLALQSRPLDSCIRTMFIV